MDRRNVERLSAAGADRVLGRLTSLQHLRPGCTLRQAVRALCDAEGLALSDDAMDRLECGDGAIGRLTRREICDLAQRIQWEWEARIGRLVRARE